jgi:hypothetical protein
MFIVAASSHTHTRICAYTLTEMIMDGMCACAVHFASHQGLIRTYICTYTDIQYIIHTRTHTCICRYFEDGTINRWIQGNAWCIFAGALLVFVGFFFSWRWYIFRGIKQIRLAKKSRFCESNAHACTKNRFLNSLLYDFRRTRDAQLDPKSRLRHTIQAGIMKRDQCTMPVKLHYVDPRVNEWWGKTLSAQEAGLYACPTPCILVKGDVARTEADILISMFKPFSEGKASWQKTAVINTEAHSLDYAGLSATDILVSYHKASDVRVNYAYALHHGVPCKESGKDCLLTAVSESVRSSSAGLPPKKRDAAAVIFMSATCDRFKGYVSDLVEKLSSSMGVDSYGKCFHTKSEKSDPLYVKGRYAYVCVCVHVCVCVGVFLCELLAYQERDIVCGGNLRVSVCVRACVCICMYVLVYSCVNCFHAKSEKSI